MFRKLLVPLDRSPLAEQAIGRAAAIARAANASIDLVIVHSRVPFDGYEEAPWNASAWCEEHSYVESVANELASGASLTVTHGVLTGDPVEMIAERAADVDADLIVMSSHSRRGLARFWLGSITEGIVRHTNIPVFVLHPEDTKTRHDAARHLPKHILVPVEDALGSTSIFPAATALARCANAKISLLRVVHPAPVIAVPAGIPVASAAALRDEPQTERMIAEAKEQLDSLAFALHGENDIDVDAHVALDGGVSSAILEFATTHGIDAIALATHARGAARVILGSVAETVLRRSGLPTLVLPCRGGGWD